jgi:hypothetical protein
MYYRQTIWDNGTVLLQERKRSYCAVSAIGTFLIWKKMEEFSANYFKNENKMGQSENRVGGGGCQANNFSSLKIKNGISCTPLNWERKALILALKDSAEALVALRVK